jgi:hypothetical protein
LTALELEHRGREKSLFMAGVRKCAIFVVLSCVLAGVVAGVLVFSVLWNPIEAPSYSVAIDSFSGLAGVRTGHALDPEFNLTLRVASMNRHGDACVEQGTYVLVAYRCVTLATSAAIQHRLCAGPGKTAEQHLVARGTGVHVPGTVLDSLAADVQHGQPVFQLVIRQPDDIEDMLDACG